MEHPHQHVGAAEVKEKLTNLKVEYQQVKTTLELHRQKGVADRGYEMGVEYTPPPPPFHSRIQQCRQKLQQFV